MDSRRSCHVHALLLVALCLIPSKIMGFVPRGLQTPTKPSSSTTELYEQQTSDKQGRKPWNVFRFVQQSSRFVTPPFASSSSKQAVQPGQVLWQPGRKQQQLFQWAPLDDVVMGGVSYSTLDNASGLWKGSVTDANSGGFVGIRSTPNVQLDLTKCKGLEWTFQSSSNMPRRLKVVLRDSTDFNGIAWTTSVDIPSNKKGQVTVKVPLNAKSFVPTRFAQIVKDSQTAKGIQKDSVTALQLVYSKFEYEGALNPQFQVGDFDLQILQVKAY